MILALIATWFLGACRQQPDADWHGLKQMIRDKFPEVRQISTAQLSEWLAQPESPLLLDARAPKEYAVSHLPDAHLTETEQQALALLQGTPKERRIVVYCSVGYRSSALAQKLQQAGFTNVFNLEGSIFEWANEGKPVYQGKQPVSLVHPFDKKWGLYLHEKLRAPLP
ncbi:MAG: rhodanese-like domain-containing protein [Acidobacteria bacterium]|nr:rhodanese-like domain-containing protein [Acidobacteriota bacterium]